MFNGSVNCIQCPYYLYNRDLNKDSFGRTPQNSNPVNIKTKIMKYTKPNIEAELRMPVMESLQYGASIKKINESIENDITEFNRQMIEAAQEYSELAKQNGEKFVPYNISTIYQVTYNRNAIISITILYYEFVGGKNSYIKTSYNYDLRTGKPISLKDLFLNGVDYKSIIDKEIREDLTINKDKYFPNAAKNFKGIAEDQPFYLDKDSIAIFFGFHQIAPLENKIPIIKIPFSKLVSVIKPVFLT